MLALALAALLSASPDVVIAHAGEAPITASELRERIRATHAAGGSAAPEPLLQDLANEALLAEEGRRLGLSRDSAVTQAMETERRRLAADALMAKGVLGAAVVSDAQLLELYHAGADGAHLGLVALATEGEAKAALERLRQGSKLSEEALHSLDPQTKASGGDYGTRSRGQLPPALAEVAFSAPIGAYAGPVKLELGWAIVQVIDRWLGDEAGFAQRRAELKRFAEEQARASFKAHYLEQLRRQAQAKIDEAFLSSTGTRLDASPAEIERSVATAHGRPALRYGAVLQELRRLFGGKEGGHASGPSVKMEIAWGLLDRFLLEEAAVKAGYGEDPAVRAGARRAECDALVRALAARLRKEAGAPAPEEVEAWYRGHLEAFQRPAHRPCSHLLVRERGQAERLRERLKSGEPFEELARTYSLDGATAVAGGSLGELADDRLQAVSGTEPALASALRSAKPGDVGAPVRSRAGWHLVRCGPTTPAQAAPLEEARPQIAARLGAERGDEAVRRRIAELRVRVRVTVDTAALQRATAAGGSP